jgi:Fe2+ or Zn2+ uptake regulation protein
MNEASISRSDGDLHELVEARLRRSGQRYTTGRRAIIELLFSAGRPVSIEDISAQLPELPRSSAYRSLVDLETAGLVRRIVANDEFARFELSEDLTEHHHHLLCVNCGKVVDFAFSSKMEQLITKAIYEVTASEGFQVQGHRFDVLGVCAACS